MADSDGEVFLDPRLARVYARVCFRFKATELSKMTV